MVDLLEIPLEKFEALLRGDELPSDDVLDALDEMLRHRLVQTLPRMHDAAGWSAALTSLRHLIPPWREAELDARERRWASRWTSYGDLIATAAMVQAARERQRTVPDEYRLPAHGRRILSELRMCGGCSQADLARRLGMKEANLSRILGMLELDRLIRREVIGREKRVYAVLEPGLRAVPRVDDGAYAPECMKAPAAGAEDARALIEPMAA